VSSIPTYRYRCAPDGLLTRTQLRAAGLRPGGHDPVAELKWRSRKARGGWRFALLYDASLALPVRPMTPGRRRALAAALADRCTCPVCGRRYPYVLPTSLGCCPECADDPTALAA
jgi:hypothetical protein